MAHFNKREKDIFESCEQLERERKRERETERDRDNATIETDGNEARCKYLYGCNQYVLGDNF